MESTSPAEYPGHEATWNSRMGGGGGAGDSFFQSTPRAISQTPSSLGSIYSAFGDYEHEARQRKFLIAEYEDTIEGLKKRLTEQKRKNQELGAEGGKLQMEAVAAEVSYEKSVKEKALIEKEYEELCKEMDELAEARNRKQALLDKVKARREENAKYCQKMTKEFLAQYMQNPKVAELVKLREDTDAKKQQLKDLRLVEEELMKTKASIVPQYKEGWEEFKKKCVKIAELHLEIREKQIRKRELGAEFKNSSSFRASKSINSNNSTWLSQQGAVTPGASQEVRNVPSLSKQATYFKQRSADVSLFKSQSRTGTQNALSSTTNGRKQSSACKELDRLLKRSDYLSSFAKKTDDNRQIPRPSSYSTPAEKQTSEKESLFSRLKSRLQKPTVIIPIQPMQRNHMVHVDTQKHFNIETKSGASINAQCKTSSKASAPAMTTDVQSPLMTTSCVPELPPPNLPQAPPIAVDQTAATLLAEKEKDLQVPTEGVDKRPQLHEATNYGVPRSSDNRDASAAPEAEPPSFFGNQTFSFGGQQTRTSSASFPSSSTSAIGFQTSMFDFLGTDGDINMAGQGNNFLSSFGGAGGLGEDTNSSDQVFSHFFGN